MPVSNDGQLPDPTLATQTVAQSAHETLSNDGMANLSQEAEGSGTKTVNSSLDQKKFNDGDQNSSQLEEGCPAPVTFDLAAASANEAFVDAETEAEGDPSYGGAILWEALIRDPSQMERPDGQLNSDLLVRYHHNRPIDISERIPRMTVHASVDRDSPEEEKRWNGPVFLIRHQAEGKIPGTIVKYPVGTKVWKGSTGDYRDVDQRLQSPDDKVRVFNTKNIPPTAAGHNFSHWETSLVIQSPHLYQELRRLVEHYPDSLPKLFVREVNDSWEYALPYTYGPLLYLFPDIEKRVLAASEENSIRPPQLPERTNADPDAEFEPDIKLALDHLVILYRHLKPIYDSVLADVQKPLAAEKPCITFGMLWYVFKPGTEVYLKDTWTPWCFAVVQSIDLDWGLYGELEWSWSILVWVLSSDGSRIARIRPASTYIGDYPGLRELSSLPVCPTAFWDADQNRERREIALSRGRMLFNALRNGFLVANYAANTAKGTSEVMCHFSSLIQTNGNRKLARL
jgi:hypothetical protein